MKMKITCIVVLLAGATAACHSGEQRIGGDATTRPDVLSDPAWDVADATVDGSPGDVDTDAAADPSPDSSPCTEPPPCPEGPVDGIMGRACYGDGACDEVPGARCRAEVAEFFDGEEYRTNPGGSCVLYTAGDLACDPVDDSGCPPGSHCLATGYRTGSEWFMCMDACTPADSSGDLYDWACGCREGYECNLSRGLCLSGCSNDRECCETWTDLNGNYRREAEEVVRYSECSNYCDGDDPEEVADCRASYSCINLGRDGA
ncbi:MAG: hypothetical protein JRG91_07910, partial [Deltaproteobacteria bacterium]|nr:hypothetical protein [Deltaproteobacteria bacterium]